MIVVGITGGIAAYKAVGVVRGLVLAGHDVHVIATESALRFVGRPTLEAISRNTVHTDLFEGVAEVRHVALGQRADLILIAPATAHTLASLAGGRPSGHDSARERRPRAARARHAHGDVGPPRDAGERRDASGARSRLRRARDGSAHGHRLRRRSHERAG